MANRTNSSEYFWSYEYYWDYIDPIPVDGRKLKVNKYSIVIAFWVGLAAFVMFLFLILLYMSRSGSSPVKTSCERSLHSCYRTSHSKVSGSLFKNRDKELDQGLKGWTEGLMLSEGVHQMWLTAHHFAVGHTPFADG
ncbi:melanocortin-2 receptor accessory protein isoform X1 [Anas platyrhynchos]|uniref:melanocortin-2 receptor accessory protein isoform X1 n=1 Tax=Anas platyrhynchos TaxID=8839 RepID=UPI000A3B531D|nr:melanocortin-2 receptor accessory protein isoform X1 [Anas platyrhynchos]|eukprot:XP_021124081.1 melanocortin-2 receptor accessory protein isoform X1 [Anas platyrhynchos]